MRTKPYKYNPETLRRLVDDGLTNAEIARELGVAQSVVNKRLNDIRKIKQVEAQVANSQKPIEIDLTLYDTVRRQGVRARVIEITDEMILLKKADFDQYQTAAAQLKHYVQVSREDYTSGESGWKRVSFERITISRL